MKNKLTQEEQILHNKLDSVEFDYQDAHWAEMQNMLGKKSFFAKYGSAMKVAAVAVTISSIVYWVSKDEITPTEKSIPETEQIGVLENTTKNTAKKTPANISATSDNSKENSLEERPSSVSPTEETSSSGIEKQPTPIHSIPETNTSEDKKEDQQITFEEAREEADQQTSTVQLGDLVVQGKKCSGETITVVTQHNQNNGKVVWFVNGSKQTQNGNQFQIELGNGNTEIKAQLIHNKLVIDEKETSISVTPPVALDFKYNDMTNVFHDLQAKLTAFPAGLRNYKWVIDGKTIGNQTQEMTYEFVKEGIYDVQLEYTDASGCISKMNKPVAIQKDFKLFFENAFSPNGDGRNDTFIPKVFTDKAFTDLEASFKMLILDLNSNLIYQANSVYEPWNGRMNNTGALMPKETYIWKVEIQNKEGIVKSFAGSFKLIE